MANNRTRVFEKKMASDTQWGKDYQVYLFDNGQGVCECPDFHNRGVVAGNLDYSCKHVTRAKGLYQESLQPRRVTVGSMNQGLLVEVFVDQNGNLALKAVDAYSGLANKAGLITEAQIAESFRQAREQLKNEKLNLNYRSSWSSNYKKW
jgi:hypothetical protein